MDVEDFLDRLYQVWSQTTGAENRVWLVEEDVDYLLGGPGTWNLWTMDQAEKREVIAGWFNNEADADFIATVHGAVADLVRVTRAALDDAERASLDRDQQEGRIADLELEILGLKQALDAR